MSELPMAGVVELFGANLKRMREWRGWSQSELARQMQDAGWPKYSQVAVSRTEEGTRSVRLDEAIALAQVLDRKIDDLLDSGNVVDSWRRLRILMEDHSSNVTGLRRAINEFEESYFLLQMLAIEHREAIDNAGGDSKVSQTMLKTLSNAELMLTRTAHDFVDEVKASWLQSDDDTQDESNVEHQETP